MKNKFHFFILFAFLGLFWLSLRTIPVNTKQINADFESLVATLSKTTQGDVFEKIIDENGKTKWVQKRTPLAVVSQHSLQSHLDQLDNINISHLTPCNAITQIGYRDIYANKLINWKQTTELSKLANSPNISVIRRKRNYLHKIKTYLTINQTPQELIQYGEDELQIAHDLLRKLEDDIITSGIAKSLTDFEASHSRTFTTETEIKAAFDALRPIINANIPKLFKPYDIPKTHVKASLRTDRFYAIGSYQKNTFIYYWDGKSFLAKDIDYLMMHELVPGHHLQIVLKRQNSLCPKLNQQITGYHGAYSEGWATYIESLGPQLGLLQTHEARLGLLDWNLIRSIRIILDVRIHYDGWTKEQVLNYWNANMPERLHALANREYNRMKKMPMQALSYKIGSKAILDLRAKEEARLGKGFDIREFHDILLRLNYVPLHSLDEAFAQASRLKDYSR